MRHWMWTRWVWGVVAGTAIAAATGTMAHAELPKAGDTITLSFPGQPERKVTVVKATKKPDGSIETEVKDAKTGETFTILDEAPDAKPQTPLAGAKVPAPPAPARTVPSIPSRPVTAARAPMAAPTPMPEASPDKDEKPRERRFFGRLFSRDRNDDVPAMTASQPDESNRRGLLDRIFGRKGDTPEAMPAQAMPAQAMPARPIIGSGNPAVPQAVPSTPPSRPVTSEPPRVMPPRPGTSIPQPLPARPVVPSVPQSMRPGQVPGGVIPAGYSSSRIALSQEIGPYTETLANDPSPSARLIAARALAQGRHASSDEVKMALFQAAKSDAYPAVRADCIGYLCRLGYFNPAFVDFVRTACSDASEEVRTAAKAAIGKMTPSMK